MCVASLAAPRLAAGSAPEMAARTGGSLSHLTRLFTPTATARRRTASPGAREQRAGRRSVWGSRLGVTRQAASDAAAASVEARSRTSHLDLDLGGISALSRLSWGSLGLLRRELAEASGGEGGEAEAEQHARDCAFDAAEVRHRSEKKLSYRGDREEMWGRCGGGVGEV